MSPGGAFMALSYLAGQRVIPGYGGGMSSAKAALESDVRVLAHEAGRRHGLRVNCISAGPLASRAASREREFNNLMSERLFEQNKRTVDQLLTDSRKLRSEGDLIAAADKLDRALFLARGSNLDTTAIAELLVKTEDELTSRRDRKRPGQSSRRPAARSTNPIFAKNSYGGGWQRLIRWSTTGR